MTRQALSNSITGNVIIHDNFYSNHLNNTRNIWVYLPPGYDFNPDSFYPVLYMADGQNLFSRDTAFGGNEWGVDETVERLIREGAMKEIIIVGVENTIDRMSEYSHTPDPEEGGGNIENYAKFLTSELKPFIDETYRTLTDSETGVMGSSMGGLSSLWLGWYYPETFRIVGALSPSLWWAGKDLTRRIAEDPKSRGPEKIWLDMGTEESSRDEDQDGIRDVLEDTRTLGEIFLSKGYVLNQDLFYYEDQGARHDEWAWSQRIDDVLMKLYPPTP